MKFIISIVALSVSFCLHAQVPSREEQMLESLKQSGIVRQEGKTIIYKVQKASQAHQSWQLGTVALYHQKFSIALEKR